MILTPKNWSTFQHYRDRCPPWIKLHRDLLVNRDFMCLPIASKAIAPMLWLLASESKDGTFDASVDELKFRLHLTEKEIKDGLKPLIDKGFFVVASNMLASCNQDAIPETETEGEKEAATNASQQNEMFDLFWQAYPKRVGKPNAQKIFARLKPTEDMLQKMISAIEIQSASKDWKKENGQFIPYPATWLSQCRWMDEVVPAKQTNRFAGDL